jgi:hypothetical protein
MEKVLHIFDKNDKNSEEEYWKNYWHSKSPSERLDALEELRQQYMKMTNAPRRLQRVINIIRK